MLTGEKPGFMLRPMSARKAFLPLCLLLLQGACSPDPYPNEKGKVLHVGLRLLPKSFDPPLIEDEGSGKCAAHVYDGLLQYHPYARPYKLIPALAESMPSVSEDRLTFTFRIRKGVRFQDDPCFEGGRGREVTAEDFIWCFKRFAHPATGAKGWWLFDGKIRGLNAWREARKAEARKLKVAGKDAPPLLGIDVPVEGFKAPDRYTLRIRLVKPYPQLLWVLAMPYTSVYPREAVLYYKEEFRNHPVGTGPFRVVEFNPVYRVVLRRNPTFREVRVPDPRRRPGDRIPGWDWKKDEERGLLVNAGKRIPLLDGIEIRFLLEDQPRWLYFKAGYLDFLNPPKDNTDEAVPGGKLSPEMKARGIRLDPWPELGTVYTCLNCEDPLLANPDLRRAIALAYDHRWTVAHLYSGQAVIAKCLIPPGVAGYIDYHPYHSDDGRAQVERAKAFLAKAGYPGGIGPDGKRLRLTFENSGASATAKMFADRFVSEMRRIGVEVDVVVNTFPQMLEKMRKKKFQIAGLAWGFDYPDAQNILQLLYGPNGSPGPNAANFENERFDRLYEKASILPDSPERTRLYEEMARIVADEVPWITRAHRIRQNLQQPWLKGFRYTETTYQYWRYADIDRGMREGLLKEWNRPTRWPLVLFALLFSWLGLASVRQARRKP